MYGDKTSFEDAKVTVTEFLDDFYDDAEDNFNQAFSNLERRLQEYFGYEPRDTENENGDKDAGGQLDAETAKRKVWGAIIMKPYANTREEAEKWANDFEQALEAYVHARIAARDGEPADKTADEPKRFIVYMDGHEFRHCSTEATAKAVVEVYNGEHEVWYEPAKD